MPKIELHTSVEETVTCQDLPSITLKRINLGRKEIWTPIRNVFLNSDVPKVVKKEILSMKTKETIFEANRVIYMGRQYNSIKSALDENDDSKVRSFLRVTEKLAKEGTSAVFSFSDFPQKKFANRFEDLLDAIHAFSEILFVPHVRYGRSTKTAIEYDAKSFCRYVDNAVKTFTEKNNKPIFVPFDLDFPASMRDEILLHYAKMGYTNIWVDFKGKGFDSRNTIRKMRTFWRNATKLFDEISKNLVIYQTNLRRIPRGVLGENKIAPSDFLGIFDYGDFVGAPFKGIIGAFDDPDYWKKKGYQSEEEFEQDLLRRATSIFDTSTYYYRPYDLVNLENKHIEKIKDGIAKLEDRWKAELATNSINGLLTHFETATLRKEILNSGRIVDYLEKKDFFNNEGSTLLDELLKTRKQEEKGKNGDKSLFDFDFSIG